MANTEWQAPEAIAFYVAQFQYFSTFCLLRQVVTEGQDEAANLLVKSTKTITTGLLQAKPIRCLVTKFVEFLTF